MRDIKFPVIDMNRYRGEWIAVANGGIIAHDKDLGTVIQKSWEKEQASRIQ